MDQSMAALHDPLLTGTGSSAALMTSKVFTEAVVGFIRKTVSRTFCNQKVYVDKTIHDALRSHIIV